VLTQDQIQALKAPFPDEALSPDTSRGFELTSIKAAYVMERLNEVFGLCGTGWRFAHSPFEEVPVPSGSAEVVTEVALQYRCAAAGEPGGAPPVTWNTQTGNWTLRTQDLCLEWSEPIFACGGRSIGRGGAALTDARKSAVTDGLTKAASMLGVGHEVFKGLVRAPRTAPRGNGNGNGKKSGNGHKVTATDFWTLYRAEGDHVPLDQAKALASEGDWSVACGKLRALVATK